MIRGILIWVCCLFFAGKTIGQTSLDSLMNAYEGHEHDTLGVKWILEIAYYHVQEGNQEDALFWNEKGRKLAFKLDYWKGVKNSFSDWAYFYSRKGNFSEAAKTYDSLVQLAWKYEDRNTVAEMLFRQGVMLRRAGRYGEATKSLLNAKSDFEQLGESKNIGDVELELGIVHDQTRAYDEALKYYQRSLSMYLNIGDKNRTSRAYQMLGANFYNREEFQKSIEYFLKSSELITNRKNLSACFGNIASCYVRLGRFEQALIYYQRSLAIKEDYDDKPGMAIAHSNIGNCYSELGIYEEAKVHVDIGVRLALEMQSPYIYQNALHQLYKTEQRAGKYKEAYEVFETFTQIRDSLLNNEQLLEINQMKAEYTFQQEKDSIFHQSEARQLVLEQEAEIQRLTVVSLYLGLAGLLFAAVVGAYLLRSRIRSNQQLSILNQTVKEKNEYLIELNRVKTRFFTIIAHDLRGPMTTFLGYYEMMLNQLQNQLHTDQDTHLDRLRENIHLSAERMLNLLDSLVNWAMKEEGALSYEPENLNLRDSFEQAFQSLEHQAQLKQINVNMDVDAAVTIWADRNSLLTVLRNLISNAIKFTPESGKIDLSGRDLGSKIDVEIIDNGVGMTNEKLKSIYEIREQKSTSGTNGEVGSGLGLNIVHDFVKMNQGSIQVQSNPDEGTSFRLRFPVGG